ncbi:serine/threonine-protein kinase-like protein DCLK1 [Melanomma pulvis-pyrius CBS 109.77]|uniref:Serine/threonine-protein kinase-like protein DCLK1 n=1 Tax=Melanomma pulvis-pyrius CBS 109.77 TaxID=1314802 RepID=A0A6A6X5B6_9PLEO|nr:serine/threonine-protein kinase-like protein DCLK1 [Melanomma pulvis-pyrius CBS 109.77]
MAPLSGSSHSFQKLKLDTHTANKKQQVASTFASFPRHDSQQNGSVRPQLDAAALEQPDPRLYTTRRQQEEGRPNGRLLSYDGAAVAVGGSDEEDDDDDIEAKFRNRTFSISFDKEVTLDSGNRLSIKDPLPRSAQPAQPQARSEASDGEEYSDHDYLEMPRRRLSHHVGESRYPLLQSTVDGLATDPGYDNQTHVASLTSEATASPLLEEVQTPQDLPAEYLLSPLSASSPIEFPTFISRRNGSQRSRSYRDLDGEGGMRKTSRRSSTRSGRSLSSMSPAASFLSRYKNADGPLKPTEPDDEGQGIGYHGEYIIGKQIGFGGFSVVKEVTTIEDGKRLVLAVKIVRKQLNDKSELENDQIQTQFDHEVEIWRFLRHPYILPLLRVYTTEFATFCITRLNKGGTLFDLVRETRRKQKNGLQPHLVKRYAYQLASAMRYLHNDVMIVHRDIKLENCLIDMTVPRADVDGGDVLLCDFGMADFVVSDQRDGPEPHSIGTNQNIGPADTSTSVAGSLQYAAPELFNAPSPVFSTAADVWAFGVVVYALLTAQLPFNEGFDAKTSMKIMKGDWDINLIRSAPAAQEGDIEDAVDLIKGCLDMDPEKRWSINGILTCSWLRECMQKYEHVSRPWIAD